VDGFRLDAFQFVAKDTTFPKLPDGFEKKFTLYYAMQGNLHEYLKEMNREVFSKYKVMSVAEGAGNSFEDAHNLVDEDRNELNMAYAFDGVDIAKSTGYDLLHFKDVFSRWDSAFAQKGWLSIFLANHDQARMVSRFASDAPAFRDASAKMLNTFILSMRGTPYCYYGDELGMTNIGFEKIEQYRDIAAINGYKKVLNDGGDIAAYMKDLKFSSRDNGRTPMQWNGSPHAGFTTGTPWLPVNTNYQEINVANQDKDPNSVLNHFRQMVRLRKENPALIHGAYHIVQREHPQVYAYTRTYEGSRLLILHNFTDREASISLPEAVSAKQLLINNYSTDTPEGKNVRLKPYQSVIYKL
jgi:oligo-1,6-glucosidase